MFSIVGILLVFGCVIGGFLMEKGKLPVLIQPAELVTIGGAAIGTVLTANPMHILKKLIFQGALCGNPEDDVRPLCQVAERRCDCHRKRCGRAG
jgi:chemotaxis protein MotA